jgi:hypothetical protein
MRLWEYREGKVVDTLVAEWESGDWSRARATAIQASLEDKIGSRPLALLVDVLIEAGWHAEAFDLVTTLEHFYPNDPVVLQKRSLVALWVDDDNAVRSYLERATRPNDVRIELLPEIVKWFAERFPELAVSALDELLSDARYRIVRPKLEELREQAVKRLGEK